MSSPKQSKPKARLPRGFRDRGAAEIMAEQSLEITQDLFTQIGLTQAQSAEITKGNSRPAGGNPALLEPVPGSRVRRVLGLWGEPHTQRVELFERRAAERAQRGGWD